MNLNFNKIAGESQEFSLIKNKRVEGLVDSKKCTVCREKLLNCENYNKKTYEYKIKTSKEVSQQRGFTYHGQDKTLVEIACGHIFHAACLGRWVYHYENKNCPNCRGDIFEEEEGNEELKGALNKVNRLDFDNLTIDDIDKFISIVNEATSLISKSVDSFYEETLSSTGSLQVWRTDTKSCPSSLSHEQINSDEE